jgi:hypothetical protein
MAMGRRPVDLMAIFYGNMVCSEWQENSPKEQRRGMKLRINVEKFGKRHEVIF